MQASLDRFGPRAMGIANVIDQARIVRDHLRASGFHDDAKDLSELISDLDRPDKVDAALRDLIERCHIKWLGDVNVQSVGWTEWSRMLDELRSACQRELKRRGSDPTRKPG